MLNFAVVDDDLKSGQIIRKIAEKFLKTRSDDYNIDVYQMPRELLFKLEEGRYYDIFLLDINMGEISGLDVAKTIREHYHQTIIIYITAYLDYTLQAFEVNAFRYIPKKDLEKKLLEALNIVVPTIENRGNQFYIIKHYRAIKRIYYRDIYYMKKSGKYVYFYHKEGEDRVRKGLQEVLDELDSKDFFEINKGLAVNILHLIGIDKGYALLRNRESLPVGRNNLSKVEERLIQYWKFTI